jgi:hypothetical protein
MPTTLESPDRGAIRTMTVAELREALESFEPDAPVVFTYNYGDRAGTSAVGVIRVVAEMPLRSTGYSATGLALREDDDEGDDNEQTAVVLG